MTATTSVVLLFITLYNAVQAGYYSNCEIVGLRDEDWRSYTLKMPINDTFRGEIISYKTKNIVRMKISSVKYLKATWEDQTLRLFTSDNFDMYEQDSSYTNDPHISVSLSFDCTKDGEDSMTFKQPVIDTNDHVPVLNEKRYDYNFGMTIPKGLKLTEILPIIATDFDVTNNKVTFRLDEENENFSLDRDGKWNSNQYTTQLTTLNEIVAPFSQKFILTATDNGFPDSKSTAVLMINVYKPEKVNAAEAEEKDGAAHPPVFAKHLYFADYSVGHELKMEEPISIKYGAQSDTVTKQTGYEEYFTVAFQGSNRDTVVVQKKSSLPTQVLDSTDFITIEIEAINEGFEHMPGRTAVLIRLPRMNNGVSAGSGSSTDCKDVVVLGYSVHTYVIPLILFLLAVFSLVFINIYVVILFVNKHRVRAGGV